MIDMSRGARGPRVMRLERACQLADMGAKLPVVEFNPCCDIERISDSMIREVGLRIRDGGDVALVMANGVSVYSLGLTLANYNRVWRAWHGGEPSPARRREARWG